MPDQYQEYHADRDASVDAVIQNESDRDTLNGAYCVGANGGSLANYTYDSGIQGITECYDNGVIFGGQLPKRPIPPPPPPPDLTGSA